MDCEACTPFGHRAEQPLRCCTLLIGPSSQSDRVAGHIPGKIDKESACRILS